MSVTTRAVLVATVEMPGSAYGPEWSVGEIQKQCSNEEVEKLKNLILKAGGRVIKVDAVKVITTVKEE